ncbi:uncharacterized protein LOC143288618 [Babylonia areolata]|uniref:uncharacterized protein LOC143288618 n=1 Tax=Babylonia areolata TaxID=304850 RepID=UPI003FCFCC17
MPISSGALEWPVSYYSKREKETGPVADGTDGGGSGGTPRGGAAAAGGSVGYEWQPQLTNREDYEKWRKKMDRKDPLKTKKRKRNTCCGCLSSNKINKENEDPTKGEPRDSPREMIRRLRRRRCFLLALVVSLFAFLLMVVFVFVFLRFSGHELLGPEDLVECTGQWRTHFLAYAEASSNGTGTDYYCCYLPDIKNLTVWTVLSQSGWPDGYVFKDKNDCTPPSSPKECKDYSAADFAQVAMPMPPCRATCGVCSPLLALKVLVLAVVVMVLV